MNGLTEIIKGFDAANLISCSSFALIPAVFCYWITQ
jgi:hypothetical protein